MEFKKYLLLFLLFIISATPELFSSAQGKNSGFSISPFFQEITLEENQAGADFYLEVENNKSYPAVFRISTVDFGALNQSGGVAFLGNSEDFSQKYGLSSWMNLEKDAIVINPGETQEIKVSLENRKALSPGGHYGAVLFKMEENGNKQNEEADSVSLNPSFASLVFLRKLGGEIYGLNLKNYELKHNPFSFSNELSLSFQNSGNVHITPRGTVKIFDPLGREVKKGIINGASGIILPESSRFFSLTLKNKAFIFIPGYYRLAIDYRYNGSDDSLARNEKFLIIPAPFIAFISALGIILVGYLKFRKRKNEKKTF